jgi:KaiC/GvpD/RAD55 family RecA-like ATPase
VEFWVKLIRNKALLSDGLSARVDLDGLVDRVVTELESRLNKPGVFILASPGCSRGSLVTELLKRGLVDAVYAYVGFGSKVDDDVRGRVIEFNSVDELAGKLGSANGRVVVVAGSTADAVRLKKKLSNAEVIYLPKYYEDAAKEVLSKDVLEVARVRHEGLGEGISPSLLREDLPSKDVELIRELSLGKNDLKDVIRDFLRKAPIDVATQAVIAGLSFLLGVGAAVSLVGSLAGRFLESVVGKWRKNRDEVLGGFVRLLGVAREVRNNYLRDERLSDERFEAVFDEVAYKWGLTIEEFAKTITNIANLTEGKQLTEEEIKKIIDDKLESIEEALEKIEEELKKVREMVGGLSVGVEVFFINDFEDGLVYPTVKLVGGELMVLGEYGYHEVVRTGFFSTLTNEVKQRIGAGSLVVLTGPKGVGKSTLATFTIWNLLRSGEVGMVLRIRELPDGEVVERFRSFIENFLVRDWKYFGNLIILYDPTGVYGQIKGVEAPSKLETTVRNVLEAVRRAIENIKSILGREPSARVGVLIILSTDLYNALSNDTKGKLEGYRLDALLNDTEFLAKLIMEYTRTSDKPSGCKMSDEELSELAGKVAGFDSGHALIARLIGEELARSNCDVGRIEELISKAKGKAEKFIILHINGLFKIQENPDTAEALVEIFALRKPFINLVTPGGPTLTPGIIELISEERGAKSLYGAEGEELRGWLARRQHDLIEEAIEKLLKCIVSEGEECKELSDALKPWKTIIGVRESLMEVSEKVRDVDGAVKYFASNYGEKLKNALKLFSNECWKRAALIIGHALAWIPIVPRPEDLSVMYLLVKGQAKIAPEDLRKSVVESLGDALKRCGVDYYLLVGDKIPRLIRYLTKDHAYALTEAFIDNYNEAVAEVNRILNIARGRGINEAERLYGLALASIIANAARLGRDVKSGDADAALHIAAFAIKSVALPDLIKSVLGALEPLHGKAPHRYLELISAASDMENLDLSTVRYIFDKLNEILDNYGDVVRGYAWSLLYAIDAYANLLEEDFGHFNSEEFRDMVGRVVDLLNELGRFKSKLGVIAWAYALAPALKHEDVKGLMGEALRINVVGKASEVLKELNDMRERVQELMSDKEFMGYVESRFVKKADEEAVRKEILQAASLLKYALAIYRLNNSEFDEAKDLLEEAFKEYREIGEYENYLTARGWALRVEAIKGSLAGKELVDGFRQLYEETFKESFGHTALYPYLSTASGVLGEYLVSLALMGDHETINKLLEEHLPVLNVDKQFSVLTRLMLNALLSSKGGLSNELKGKLSVNPEELIDAFGYIMLRNSLPALRVALGIEKPEDGIKLCEEFNDVDCIDLVLAVKGNSVAVKQLREWVIDAFNDSLKGFGSDVEWLINKFRGLVSGLDGRSLVQLTAPTNSMAQLALILHALINGNKELAKAHALYGAVRVAKKLPTRLFLEVYKECCDMESESFRLALAKLFFFHI